MATFYDSLYPCECCEECHKSTPVQYGELVNGVFYCNSCIGGVRRRMARREHERSVLMQESRIAADKSAALRNSAEAELYRLLVERLKGKKIKPEDVAPFAALLRALDSTH